MMKQSKWLILGIVVMALLSGGCASLTFQRELPRQAFVASGEDDLTRYMPIIVTESSKHTYNKIGRPVFKMEAGEAQLSINPEVAVAYAEQRSFKAGSGQYYTNLVYRIHFDQVPFSLLPFNLTSGKNVGLIFVVTLNESRQPVLITTVHTCGCYLAMVPTHFLPSDAYPKGWDIDTQRVYGATIPGQLMFDDLGDKKLVIYLQDETHRIIHLEPVLLDDVVAKMESHPLMIKPMEDLDRLMLDDQSLSMFESSGTRLGYVRDSYKPFEFLLMGWWALDGRIGVDKRYGKIGDEGPVFYTSLKPWARDESDMRDFPRFLEYWGWHL